MYYACAMAKHLSGHAKKWLMITGISVLILGGGYGGYIWYQQNQTKQAAQQEDRVGKTQKKLEEASFRGDTNLAARYTERLEMGDVDGAGSLYSKAIEEAETVPEKTTLAEQAITVAYQQKNYDQALKFALILDQIGSSHRTLISIADIYAAQKNVDHEKEDIQKAIAAIEALPQDSPEREFISIYQGRLTNLEGAV